MEISTDIVFPPYRELYGCSGTDCFYHYRDIINRKSDRDNHQAYEDRALRLLSGLED